MNNNDMTIRILGDQPDGTTIEAGGVEASVNGPYTYYVHPGLADREAYRAALSAFLFQWVTELNDWADGPEEDE